MKISSIFFDHHSTTPIHPQVYDVMKNYYEGEYGNPHSTDHALGWKAKGAIDEAREEVASLVGGFPED